MVRVEEHVKAQGALQAAYDGSNEPADPKALPKDLVGLGNLVKTKLESGDFEIIDVGLTDDVDADVDADEDYW